MKYKGIIFDLDGVICFTDRYHFVAWKSLADELGIPFDESKNNLLRGVSRMESLNIVLGERASDFSPEQKTELADRKNRIYQNLLHKMTPDDLSDEVRNTLETLRSKGLKMAIGSSSKNAPLILNQIGLGNWFDAISDGNNITHSKPHPEVFLIASALLGLSPQVCLIVEDARSGISAADAGGFDSAGIGDAMQDPRATFSLNTFSDLLSIEGIND